MPRRPRIHVPNGFYHVTLRGNHRQAIFFAPDDRRLLGNIIRRSIERSPARVHAYCWMSNHVHLLIQAGDVPIGRLVQRVASRYARVVQNHIPTTGHLFERRYHAVVVDADRHLLALLRYIHLNPVRAGIARTADDYPWSSHRAYCGAAAEPWLTTDSVLRRWSADRATAIRQYREFMTGPDPSPSGTPWAALNRRDPRVLGDDAFLSRVGMSDDTAQSIPRLETLLIEACRVHDVMVDDLVSSGTGRRLGRARAWIAHEATCRRIANASQVARRLNRSESSVRELIQRHYPPTKR